MDLDDIIDTKLLLSIPPQPQVQCETYYQLRALHILALKFGLRDAADALRDTFKV